MIRRLRVKFVAINMAIVTLLLSVILGLTYYFTKVNLESESITRMQDLAAQPFHRPVPGGEVQLPYPVLEVGPHGEILGKDAGFFDLSEDEEQAALVADIARQEQSVGIIEAYGLRYYRAVTPVGQRLVFADMSGETAALHSLTRTCALIGVLGFLAFLGASILLSRWAVRPVDRAWEQQRRFVADASHELKTPLAVITTNAELLTSPDWDSDSKERFSANILAMARQMRGLVEQLLQLARADAAQGEPVHRTVDLSALTEEAALPFEAAFFEKGLELEVAVSPGIQVRGDPGQLRQVVEILLDNAQKYASPGGRTWVTLERSGKSCLLAVRDEGEPIPQQELTELFKRFYRADEARSRDGSFGLGLSIAESIVLQHKGRIWAESGGGVNSFLVELPPA